MSKLDKAKEELGWLKVLFAIAIATDLSLMGYLAQHYENQGVLFSLLNVLAIFLDTIIVIVINKKAYKKIDEIGDL